MTIFLVRHGETEWNRARRYQGWTDSPLTDDGIAQAEAIGRRLRTLPEAVDAAIVASPIGRARRTAEIVADCLGRTAPPRFDERLREIPSEAVRAFWAQTEQEERAAFDTIMSLIMEAWDSDPGTHLYHYAPYEPSAFKRLSCRYAMREQDVDRLLRGGRFVDLYHVVRQSLRSRLKEPGLFDHGSHPLDHALVAGSEYLG